MITAWPFPHWSQVPGQDGFRGVTAGWHFYDEKLGWEICYDPVGAVLRRSISGRPPQKRGRLRILNRKVFSRKGMLGSCNRTSVFHR